MDEPRPPRPLPAAGAPAEASPLPSAARAPLIVRVDVDTQHGFCDPRGGLYVRGAEVALARVAALNADAERRGLALVGSVDTHDYASPELARNGGPWPDHCLKGTWDWLKPPSTLPARARFIGREPTDIARAFDDGRAALYFEKDRYSLFDNANAEPALDWLRARARAEGRRLLFEVYGIASDYCVKAAALGLRERGEQVRVVEDATAGVTAEGHRAALAALAAAGVELVRASEVLGGEAREHAASAGGPAAIGGASGQPVAVAAAVASGTAAEAALAGARA